MYKLKVAGSRETLNTDLMTVSTSFSNVFCGYVWAAIPGNRKKIVYKRTNHTAVEVAHLEVRISTIDLRVNGSSKSFNEFNTLQKF